MKKFPLRMSLDVLGHDVPIVVKKIDEKLHGHFSAKEMLIEINESSDQKERTCLHEIFHAVIHRTGIDLDGQAEEMLVTALENVVYENVPIDWTAFYRKHRVKK